MSFSFIQSLTKDHFTKRGWRPSLAISLSALLKNLCRAENLEARMDAWLSLNAWTWARTLGDKKSGDKLKSFVRLHMLVDLLSEEEQIRNCVQESVVHILEETDGIQLFADAGMPGQRGLVSELWNRVLETVLPAPHYDTDLENLIRRQFATEAEANRLRETDPATFHQLATLLFPAQRLPEPSQLRQSFADAFRLLASRIQAHGLSPDLRVRSVKSALGKSPFYRFPSSSENLAAMWHAGEELALPLEAWRRNAFECVVLLETIKDRLDTEGVSMEIVHSLSVIVLCLNRMELMLAVMEHPEGQERSVAIQKLLVDLVRASKDDKSVLSLLDTSISQLHRKIVERSGETGRHYIARNLREYRGIWLAAAGGGLLTTLTAAIKMKIAHAHIALFLIGLGSGINYAVSFLILQHFHLVLATKQPAMTAAHLADILRVKRGKERLDEIADFASRIFSSQIAAAMGNVLMVSVGAYAFDQLWRWFLGRSYLDMETADSVFKALSPFDSGTVFYAALTGVILWLASVFGGWFGNFSVYHKLPQAIRYHPWRGFLGKKRLERYSENFEHHITGWGTNISLGLMLGMLPVVGVFLGLPLDVRHVTLSTGQLAFACAALEQDWFAGGWFLRAFSGIVTMFILNLSVSFLLSFFTAAKAWNLKRSEVAEVLFYIVKRFLRNPWQFTRPPRQ